MAPAPWRSAPTSSTPPSSAIPAPSHSTKQVKWDMGFVPRHTDLANGRRKSILRDIKGGIHYAYFDSPTQVLNYAYRAPNGIWNSPITIDSTAYAGQYLSIGADNNGNPGIAYFVGSTG